MSSTKLRNQSRNLILTDKVEEAFTMFARMKGLLGRNHLAREQALWLAPGNSIHTFFMKFPIDVVFVDNELRVKKVIQRVPPGQLIWPVWGASSVFELAAGVATPDKISEGDQLHVGA